MNSHDPDSFSNPSIFSSTLLLPRSTHSQDQSDEHRNNVMSDQAAHFGGPEDFTEHLTEYMNGTRQWQGAGKDTTADETHTGEKDESIFEPVDTSTPPSPFSESAHMPVGRFSPEQQSPSSLRNPKTRSQSIDAEATFLRVSELQAEVERMRQEEEARLSQIRELEHENEALKKENEEAHQRFDEIEKLSQPEGVTTQSDGEPHGDKSEDLQKADERIVELQRKLKKAQEEAETLRCEYDSFKENGGDALVDLKEELQKQRQAAEDERNKSFIIAREAAKLSEANEQNNAIIETLRAETEAMNEKYDQMYDELQETRRIMHDAEDENENLLQDLASQKVTASHVKEQLQDKTTELRAAHATIASMRSQLTEQQTKQRDSIEDAAEIKTLTAQHDSALNAQKLNSEKSIARLRDALQSATQSRQKSESDLKRSHALELARLGSRIRALEQLQTFSADDAVEAEAPSTHSIEDELRTAIRVLNNKLTAANAAARSAKAEAEKAVEEADRRNRDVNEELERRVWSAVERREEEWFRRAELLFKERERMGKVLLQGWGREECGRARQGEKQNYRYRYIEKAT